MPSFLGAYRTSSLEGYLFGGLFAWRAVCFFCVCDFVFFLVSVAGSTFSSLPDGLRHFFGDHNPYSILYIICDI